MAESFIRLPPDNTGKAVRTLDATIGGVLVQHQAYVLVDSSGSILGTGSAAPAGTENALIVRNIPSGTQTVTGAVTVSNFPATQPISAIALPLPTGAALDATLTGGTQKTKLVDTGGTNVASISAAGAVKTDGSAVTQPVSAAALPLPTGAATQTTLALIETSLGGGLPTALGGSGGLKGEVVASLPAGTNNIGEVTAVPGTTGGSSVYRNIDLLNIGQVVKASAGQIYGIHCYNTNAGATRYLKIYNKATAAVATDTPVMTYVVNGTVPLFISFETGIAFGAGISVRATTGIADNDNVAPAANEVILNLIYK